MLKMKVCIFPQIRDIFRNKNKNISVHLDG